MAFAPDGKRLLTGDWEDADIRLWAAENLLKPAATLKGIQTTIKAGCWSQATVAFAPDGHSFASVVGGADHGGARIPTLLTIWDAKKLAPTASAVSSKLNRLEWVG